MVLAQGLTFPVYGQPWFAAHLGLAAARMVGSFVGGTAR